MNWLQKALVNVGLANPTQSIPPIPIGQMPVYPKAELQTFINTYSNNASLFIVVSMIAKKFAYIPRMVYNVKDTSADKQYKFTIKQRGFKRKTAVDLHRKAYDETVITDNPLSEIMMNPNDDFGQDSYYELLATYYLLCGEGFEYLNRGLSPDELLTMSDEDIEATPIEERVLLPPQYVGLIIERDSYSITGGQVTGYQIINNGKPLNLRKAEVLHWRRPNPNFNWWDLSHFRGLSPLYAGLKILTQDDSITDASVAMYQSGGARGAIVSKEGTKPVNLTPEQLTSIDRAINQKVNGNSNKGSVARIPGLWEYLDMGMSSVDMQLVDATDKVFVKICNLYGVNPNLFITGSTFNNIEQARADFMTNLVIPMACSLRDEENRMFLPAFGYDVTPSGKIQTRVTTDLDISGLSELQDDMEKVAASLVPAWWLTGNERRTIMEQEESTDPNMDLFFMPNNLITSDDAAMPPETLTNTPYGSGASGNGKLPNPAGNGNGKQPSNS